MFYLIMSLYHVRKRTLNVKLNGGFHVVRKPVHIHDFNEQLALMEIGPNEQLIRGWTILPCAITSHYPLPVLIGHLLTRHMLWKV